MALFKYPPSFCVLDVLTFNFPSICTFIIPANPPPKPVADVVGVQLAAAIEKVGAVALNPFERSKDDLEDSKAALILAFCSELNKY